MPTGDAPGGAADLAAVAVRARAYPWDVLGDTGFVDRVRALEVDHVVLAAAYHSVRAATPWHPAHLLVPARHAALYRPVDPAVWAGRRLVPAAADWLAPDDPFGAAARVLSGAGIEVTAWIVLTHATRLGAAFPDVSVVNCVGDRYPYALCPAQPEVRAYASTLAGEAIRDTPVTGVCLEACGQLGIGHGDHHDKTAGAWGPSCARLLSVCCCPACRRGWSARGLDPAETVAALRAAVRRLIHDDTAPSGLDEEVVEVLLATRLAAADALRRDVLAALRAARPDLPDLRVILHGHPDPWQTGAAPGLPPSGGTAGGTAGDDVRAVVVPCWTPEPESARAIRDTRALLAGRAAGGALGRAAVGGYVTALPPVRGPRIGPHVQALRAAGMAELDLYHLGLVGPSRWPVLAEAVRAARRTGSG